MNELDNVCRVCGSPMWKHLASGKSYYYYCVNCKKLISAAENKKQGRIKQAVVRLLLPIVRKLSKK